MAYYGVQADSIVTPFAGVWIEMETLGTEAELLKSLPSRECGLKYPNIANLKVPLGSLPSRECGLK